MNFRSPKAQISIFSFLGVFILIAATLFFFLLDDEPKENSLLIISSSQTLYSPLTFAVEECLHSLSLEGLQFIGKRGGYYTEIRPEFLLGNATLWTLESLDVSPSQSMTEKALSRYIDERLPFCLDHFNQFKKMGYTIDAGDPITTALFFNGGIALSTSYPITYKNSESEGSLQKFSIADSTIDIFSIFNISKSIIQLGKESPNSICFTCIHSLSKKTNLSVDILRINSTFFLFKISSPIRQNPILSSPYNFSFGMSFEGMSCKNLITLESPDLVEDCLREAP